MTGADEAWKVAILAQEQIHIEQSLNWLYYFGEPNGEHNLDLYQKLSWLSRVDAKILAERLRSRIDEGIIQILKGRNP